MKHNFFCLATLTALLTACGQSTQTSEQQASTPTAPTTECFAYTTAQDTVTLSLMTNGSAVTGHLVYRLAAKDSNVGTIQGEMRGDTLFADYTFMSEGMQSVREVAFLRTNDGLTEGYGKLGERSGKVVFENHRALTFGSLKLKKTTCPD